MHTFWKWIFCPILRIMLKIKLKMDSENAPHFQNIFGMYIFLKYFQNTQISKIFSRWSKFLKYLQNFIILKIYFHIHFQNNSGNVTKNCFLECMNFKNIFIIVRFSAQLFYPFSEWILRIYVKIFRKWNQILRIFSDFCNFCHFYSHMTHDPY